MCGLVEAGKKPATMESEKMNMNTPDVATSNDNIVVVGEVVSRTPTHVVVLYESMSGLSQLNITRTEFDVGNSTGVKLDERSTDTQRAFAVKRCECPVCNNNNDMADEVIANNKDPSTLRDELQAINVRRQVIEIDGVRSVVKCDTCAGKGKITSLPMNLSPVIDGEWGDLVESMRVGELPPTQMKPFMGRFKGKRAGIVDEWDIPMEYRELTVDNIHGETVGTGNHMVINRAYANESNNFVGMQIGRTKTDVYAFAQHSDVLPHFMDWASQNGLPFHAYATNFGCDAMIDIHICDLQSKDEAIQSMRDARENGTGISTTGFEAFDDLLNPANMSFGVQIRHSFDGSLSIRGVMQRLVCANGMVGTREINLMAAQHKKGVWETISFSAIAEMVMTLVGELFNQYEAVESMNEITLNPTDLEALIALQVERGIMSYPSIGQDAQLTGGRQYRLFTQGWADPNQEWVSVGEQHDGSQAGTLYQAYQNMNGIINHQPSIRDAHGSVDGGKAISFSKTEQDLEKQHSLFIEVQNDAVRAFTQATGAEPKAGELQAFVDEYGIPMLNNMVAQESRTETVSKDRAGNVTIRQWNAGDILPTIVKNVGSNNEVTRPLTAQFNMAVVA